jgi:DNA-3-methyladenine glycosylase II
MISIYTAENLPSLCFEVARRDEHLQVILDTEGLPPLWVRPNTYETLVLTILEQQVSLASAYAAYRRLKEKIGEVTPAKLLRLTDEELRSCSFTRQKMLYARLLAEAILEGRVDLEALAGEEDEAVRQTLTALKGIGNWTADIYLLHALQRTDIFPLGDLALVNAIRRVKNAPGLTKEAMLAMAEPWRPYRSIATMIFWHDYLRKRKTAVLH